MNVVSLNFQGYNINQKLCKYAVAMKEHNWTKILLRPFSSIYGWITDVRNLLYDRRFLRVGRPSQFTISVGNLTVGGTGKSPMIEYLIEKFLPSTHTAVLSRGYGRSTKGLLFGVPGATAADIGDEPLQFFQKYGKNVIVAVCENRVKGASAIHRRYPTHNLLLLDDAFQHRAIDRDINILLNDYSRPFYTDLPFPAGRLRESRSGAKRADLVVVTKCPATLSEPEKEQIRTKIKMYTQEDAPVFFSGIRYSSPLGFDLLPVSLKKVKVVTGIASPQPFLTFLKGQYEVIEEIIFPDHHNYTTDDLQRLIKNLKNDTFVLTTEKDMVKLKPLAEQESQSARFAFISIAVDFGTDEFAFQDWIDHKTKI
jgi:tetraacyldisaccharide 4'-kinase